MNEPKFFLLKNIHVYINNNTDDGGEKKLLKKKEMKLSFFNHNTFNI